MRCIALVALALLPLFGRDVRAQSNGTSPTSVVIGDSALEARVKQVASQLRCPVCQGLSLQDSPSELSQEMKNLVREQLRAGKTPDEVRRYFIQRYGEWILLEPQAHGFNWVVYALPVLLLIAGGGALTFALRRWTSGADVRESSVSGEEEETPDAVEA